MTAPATNNNNPAVEFPVYGPENKPKTKLDVVGDYVGKKVKTITAEFRKPTRADVIQAGQHTKEGIVDGAKFVGYRVGNLLEGAWKTAVVAQVLYVAAAISFAYLVVKCTFCRLTDNYFNLDYKGTAEKTGELFATAFKSTCAIGAGVVGFVSPYYGTEANRYIGLKKASQEEIDQANAKGQEAEEAQEVAKTSVESYRNAIAKAATTQAWLEEATAGLNAARAEQAAEFRIIAWAFGNSERLVQAQANFDEATAAYEKASANVTTRYEAMTQAVAKAEKLTVEANKVIKHAVSSEAEPVAKFEVQL